MHTNVMRVAAAALAALSHSAAVAGGQVNMEEGKKLFTSATTPACAVCHTLDHAGAQGAVGPNLDELKPDAARVEKALRNGIGQMPVFTTLTEEQIKLLANYVSAATGAAK